MDKSHTNSRKKTKKWSAKKIIPVFILLTAFTLFVAGAGTLITQEQSSSSYLPLDAVVVASDIASNSIDGQDSQEDNAVFYNVVVTYRYVVNEKTFTNHQIVGKASRNDPSAAQKTVIEYPAGSIIKITYNPDAPSQSRITVPSFPGPVVFFLAGILSLVSAWLAFVYIPEPKSAAPVPWPAARKKTSFPEAEKNLGETKESDAVDDSGLSGKWRLEYQMPSMKEIISASQNGKSLLRSDMKAVMSGGIESLVITISRDEMEFSFKDSKIQGSCDILSKYKRQGNTLDLTHVSMDFIIADLEGFPPASYTYELKGSKLTLTSCEIKGLANRRIVYHLSCIEAEGQGEKKALNP